MNRVLEKKMDPVSLSWGDVSLCASNVVGAAASVLSKMGYMPAFFPLLGSLSHAVAFGMESVELIKAGALGIEELKKEITEKELFKGKVEEYAKVQEFIEGNFISPQLIDSLF